MGTHATPELTSPVSRGQSASTGVLQNIGTALGSATAGTLSGGIGNFINNSLGGVVDRGVQSFQNAAKSPSATIANPLEGGSSFAVSTSSVNPLSIQNDSSSDVLSKTVVQTDAQSTSLPSQGFGSVIPPDNLSPELPANGIKVHVQPAVTYGGPTQISYKGEAASRVTGSVNDNTINKNLVPTASAEDPYNGRQNGAATFGTQAKPATGNPSLPADGGPTSSIQVRATADEGQPNNLIPFENGTADKP